MKKVKVLFVILAVAVTCAALIAQQPPAGAAGGRGGGQRGAMPQVPPASGPMLDLANNIVAAINKQDSAALQKLVASDAVYLDEDGHAPPVGRWVMNLTTGTPAKQITISNSHSQIFDNVGWLSFNYELTENFQGAPKTVKGTASIVAKKAASGDWQMQLIHGALMQKVAGLTQ